MLPIFIFTRCNKQNRMRSLAKINLNRLSLKKLSIEDLVALCCEKNRAAQSEIYMRYSKAMYNVAFRIVKDAHFAEDVMQEGFLKAFTKIGDFEGKVAFGAWLKRIVVNHSIDFYKKNGKLLTQDFEQIVYKLEETAEVAEGGNLEELKVSQILEAIKGLKENYSTILTLFFIEGYDQEEITEILGISYSNCRTLLSRAKENLRKKLQES